VVELGNRYQINGWAYTQPFFQYFARPNGTTEIANAAVLGVLAGLVF
jgi:carbohydrate-selective porin OprB